MAVNFSINCICFVQVANTVTLRIKSQHFRKHFYKMSLGFGKYCLFSEILLCFLKCCVLWSSGPDKKHISAQLRNICYVKISIFEKTHIQLQRKSVHEAHFLRPLVGASLLVSNTVIKNKKDNNSFILSHIGRILFWMQRGMNNDLINIIWFKPWHKGNLVFSLHREST